MKVAGDHAVANNAALAYLGDRLGLWRALASMPATTSSELADRTGLAERYLREWLAAQAAAGYLSYDPTDQRFTLPAEHAMVLADDDSPAALAGEYEVTAAIWAGVERLAHVFATGEGIAWYGAGSAGGHGRRAVLPAPLRQLARAPVAARRWTD